MKKIITPLIITILSSVIFTSCAPRTAQQPPQTNVTQPPAQQTPQPNTANQPMGNMAAYYVYTANEDEGTVSVINMATMQTTVTVPVSLLFIISYYP